MRFGLMAAVAACVVAVPAEAAQTVINFSDGVVGQPIGAKYPGINFEGAVYARCDAACPSGRGLYAAPANGTSFSIVFAELQDRFTFIPIGANNISIRPFGPFGPTPFQITVLAPFDKDSLVFIENGSTTRVDFSSASPFGIDQFRFGFEVPEPSTWTLMIVGFGAVGGMLRRKEKRALSYGK